MTRLSARCINQVRPSHFSVSMSVLYDSGDAKCAAHGSRAQCPNCKFSYLGAGKAILPNFLQHFSIPLLKKTNVGFVSGQTNNVSSCE